MPQPSSAVSIWVGHWGTPCTVTVEEEARQAPHMAAADCGQLLAIDEFDRQLSMRKIERHPCLETTRIYKRAPWLKHAYYAHILDHATRVAPPTAAARRVLANPYL